MSMNDPFVLSANPFQIPNPKSSDSLTLPNRSNSFHIIGDGSTTLTSGLQSLHSQYIIPHRGIIKTETALQALGLQKGNLFHKLFFGHTSVKFGSPK